MNISQREKTLNIMFKYRPAIRNILILNLSEIMIENRITYRLRIQNSCKLDRASNISLCCLPRLINVFAHTAQNPI